MHTLLLGIAAICLCTLLLMVFVLVPLIVSDGQSKETITIMTYNILNGAGVDPVFEKWAADHGYSGNRLPKILEVIKAADPDILGIQEAAGWDKGNPSIAQQVAKELDMNYSLAKCIHPESGFNHVVLLTKFSIEEVEDYQSHFSNAALRARVTTHKGKSIHLFVAHLKSSGLGPTLEVQRRELSFLLERMRPYLNSSTIMMGDMNFIARWDFLSDEIGDDLRKAGWRHAAGKEIDQVWFSPILSDKSIIKRLTLPRSLIEGASDHLPVAIKVDIYPNLPLPLILFLRLLKFIEDTTWRLPLPHKLQPYLHNS